MDPFAIHATAVIAATGVAIAVFLGLATYVVTQNLYRPTAWLFSLTCLIIAGTYFASFLTVSGSENSLLLFLRLRWVAIIFGPTLFFHLLIFYFPPSWQRYRVGVLSTLYGLSFILATMTLLTDQVIVAPMPQHTPHIALPQPGPLMPYQVGFFFLQLLGIMTSLLQGYRHTHSAAMQGQLRLLILPTALVFIASTLHCFNVFIGETFLVPHEIPDGLLLLAAFFYLKAVVHYGSFIGRPLAWPRLLYSGLMAVGGLASFYLTFMLDGWLMTYSHFPYPPATAILVLVAAASFPAAQRWVRPRLDRWLFFQETQQETLAGHLGETLAIQTNEVGLFDNLLETICLLLDVPCGFIAETTTTDRMAIRAVRGPLPLHLEDTLTPLRSMDQIKRAQLLLPAHLPQQSTPVWTRMALLCPFHVNSFNGLLVLGDKKRGSPFTAQDIALCANLIDQIRERPVGRAVPAGDQLPFESVSPPDGPDQEPEEKIATKTPASVTIATSVPSIEIRLLGPLQVIHNGQPVPESAWSSEKAKLMLAYLLWKSPHGATREELSDLLWPDRSLKETANVFHVTLHRLRRVFQPKGKDKKGVKYIIYDRNRYRFNCDAPHRLDMVEFQMLAASPNIADQTAALELYNGPYLEDTAWVLPAEVEVERRRLEQRYADTLRQLAAQSDERSAILYLEKLLTVEPADEVAYQRLVLYYLAQGRRDLACRQVERWQQALAELGLDPTADTVALWQTVRAKDAASRNGLKTFS